MLRVPGLLFCHAFAVCHKIWPYRRDVVAVILPKKIKFKKSLSRTIFADKYNGTVPDDADNTRKSLITEKVVCELYFQLVVVLEEFDFSV